MSDLYFLYNFQDVISTTNTTFKVFLSFHSYSEVITFPWCHSSDPCPDYVTLLEGGTVMSKVCKFFWIVFIGKLM